MLFFVFNSIYDLLGKIIINLKLHSQNDIEKGGLCKETSELTFSDVRDMVGGLLLVDCRGAPDCGGQ